MFKFGETPPIRLIKVLFYTGWIPIAYKAALFGEEIYSTSTYMTTVKEGYFDTAKAVNDLPKGIVYGVVAFVVAVVIWKIFCEILLIVLRFFESRR
ncbi:hypothetical protein [Paenibacillus tyrfis]|uniref:hypothetical protein n=1 Tax=Paenibacillus tyrfis TaxID=1501230 RepID=UPI00209ECBCE|nr:hypothetical protein [Paenibacillus tyrfis]MCP1305719.1 hypothetical protein [Paenibacillus tyrfis]